MVVKTEVRLSTPSERSGKVPTLETRSVGGKSTGSRWSGSRVDTRQPQTIGSSGGAGSVRYSQPLGVTRTLSSISIPPFARHIDGGLDRQAEISLDDGVVAFLELGRFGIEHADTAAEPMLDILAVARGIDPFADEAIEIAPFDTRLQLGEGGHLRVMQDFVDLALSRVARPTQKFRANPTL